MVRYDGGPNLMTYLDWLEMHLSELTEEDKKNAITSIESTLYMLDNLKGVKMIGPPSEEKQRARRFLDRHIPIWGLQEFHRLYTENSS